MITSKYVLCAERVIRDADTNSVSIIDVLDEIQTPGFPRLIPRIMAVWVLERDSLEDTQQPAASFHILLNDEELHQGDLNVDFQGVLRTRSFLTLGGLVIPGPGTLTMSFRIEEEEVASYWMKVVQLGGPQVQLGLG